MSRESQARLLSTYAPIRARSTRCSLSRADSTLPWRRLRYTPKETAQRCGGFAALLPLDSDDVLGATAHFADNRHVSAGSGARDPRGPVD